MKDDFRIEIEYEDSKEADQCLTDLYAYLLDCYENEDKENDATDTKKFSAEPSV